MAVNLARYQQNAQLLQWRLYMPIMGGLEPEDRRTPTNDCRPVNERYTLVHRKDRA